MENKNLKGIRVSVAADTKCCLCRPLKALHLVLAGPGRIVCHFYPSSISEPALSVVIKAHLMTLPEGTPSLA